MLFHELRYVVLLTLVLAVHWSLRGERARQRWLLLCSYVFYGAWNPAFLGLLVGTTLVGFLGALGMERAATRRRRRAWLAASLVGCFGLLALFKYYGFVARSAMAWLEALGAETWSRGLGEAAAALLRALGAEASPERLDLLLPVGISFFVFQTSSYVLDVAQGRLRAERSLTNVAFFVAFFPQLVAGPILRASDFLPQLAEPRSPAQVPWRPALLLFLTGWVKKACLADHAAFGADLVFADPGAYGPSSLLLGVALYAVQIYGDFSGYSDMAVAAGSLLGYRLPENFRHPYLACSVTDFWRRWHVSLSTWFRDYLYIPLGGNRRGAAATAFNLALVFLLCGLWHGAAWTFVLWGLYHGAWLSAERLFAGGRLRDGWGPVGRLVTLLVVCAGWVLFRSRSLDAVGQYFAGLLGGGGDAALPPAWWLLVLAFALAHATFGRRPLESRLERLPTWAFATAYGATVALLLPWAAAGEKPFIYFQF